MHSTASAAAIIAARIHTLLENKRHILIAIDGRCAAGKTTLSAHLHALYGYAVVHMDHFFLRPEQRTAERMRMPGENVDHERLLSEALIPLSRGEACVYRPYDCKTGTYQAPIHMERGAVAVIEGSYACHAALRAYYDFTVFLNVGQAEQMRRIAYRNGQAAAHVFREKWIPLEELYFSHHNIAQSCDLYFDTSSGAHI